MFEKRKTFVGTGLAIIFFVSITLLALHYVYKIDAKTEACDVYDMEYRSMKIDDYCVDKDVAYLVYMDCDGAYKNMRCKAKVVQQGDLEE